MSTIDQDSNGHIRRLNDALRITGIGGAVAMTAGVAGLAEVALLPTRAL